MNPLWLLLPYCNLLIIEGIRFYLLEHALNNLMEQSSFKNRLNRFKALNIKWYKWLLRFGKDWLVLGILGGVAVSGLKQFSSSVLPYTMMALGTILFMGAYAPIVLWLLASGVHLPRFFRSSAVWMAIPDYVPANKRRVALWGGIFLLAGLSSLMVGIRNTSVMSLLWSCFTLSLGFISVFKGISLKSEGMEDSQNAEKAG